jgi:hypothetical protein
MGNCGKVFGLRNDVACIDRVFTQGHRIWLVFSPRPYFNPSFLRKQESMKPSENHERLDSCLRRNDGIWEGRGAVLWLSAAPGQMRWPGYRIGSDISTP